MREFDIAHHHVSEDSPPLCLFDISAFFNKDVEKAHDMIETLLDAGCEFIKGEILNTPDVALDDGTTTTYMTKEGDIVEENYRSIMERKALPLSKYKELFGKYREQGIEIVLSVYNFEGVDFAVEELDACGLKIASSNIVHRPLIEYVAGTDVPMFIDTGKSTLEEISRAMQWARDAGGERIVVQHSPPAPPEPVQKHNLNMMTTFRQTFDCPVSLSDHHDGEEMMYAATAMGVEVLETGVCPDELLNEQDVGHALPLSKVADVKKKCENIHEALGEGMRHLKRDRKAPLARMGLVANTDLSEGDQINLENITFAFPQRGIPVENWGMVEGWILKSNLSNREPVTWNDIQSVSS